MAAKKKADAKVPAAKDPKREAKLLAAIMAAPDDTAPRLVYADWLTEHGDPRGEFITISCELNRPLWTNRTIPNGEGRKGELGAQQQALLKKHGKAWLEPVRPFLRTWVWERGFIERLYVNASFFPGSRTVFEQHPVRTLCFEGLKPGDIEKFRDIELGLCRELDLTEAPITEKNVGALLGPQFSRIQKLNFHNARLLKNGLVDLAEKSHFRALEYLAIASCQFDDAGLQALAASKALPSLKTLFVSDWITEVASPATMDALRKRFEVTLQ
jgi:uncharacterized protein (TIGR02996 family)